jgi:hypothetical protein
MRVFDGVAEFVAVGDEVVVVEENPSNLMGEESVVT